MTIFLAYEGKGQFCQSCMMSDHTHEECSLHPSCAVPLVCIRESPSGGMREKVYLPKDPELKRVPRRGCFSWNDGSYTTPYCRFNHMHSQCSSPNHRRPCKGTLFTLEWISGTKACETWPPPIPLVLHYGCVEAILWRLIRPMILYFLLKL